MKLIAVVRIRGGVGVRKDVNKTLKLLRIDRKHSCAVVSDSKVNMGMIDKVKDYVTYGEIDKDTLIKLLKSRSSSTNPEKEAKDTLEKGKLGAVFRLHPPRGGFKSIKKAFKNKGDLGYRGEEINKLLLRMI